MESDAGTVFRLVTVVGGPILLAAVFLFGIWRSRQRVSGADPEHGTGPSGPDQVGQVATGKAEDTRPLGRAMIAFAGMAALVLIATLIVYVA